jgi:peptidoglycan hydrolase-like protein with peptidoglycan-binding domain
LRKINALLLMGSLLLCSAGLASAEQTSKKTTKKHVSGKHHATGKHARARKGSWKNHGQQGIAPERAREIQEALIHQNYLSGEASGIWDARTQEAMARYQADNGWQSKVTPDSRALIKLGLGPRYSEKDLLNPQSASDSVTTASASSGSPASSSAPRDKQ